MFPLRPHARRSRALAIGLALAVASVAPRAARADEIDRCVDASDRGQRARQAGRLLEAKELFVTCAASTCPGAIRRACAEWIAAVDASLPSIVVSVRGEREDLPSARVTLDDRTVVQGAAIPLDPGPHRVFVSAEGFTSSSVDVIAREGEHRRVVEIAVVRSAARANLPPTAGPAPSAPPERDGVSPLRIAAFATGGLAVVALGGFTYFGLTGKSDAANLRETCAPTCSEAARDSVRGTYVAADISLVTAIVLAGVSVTLFLISGR